MAQPVAGAVVAIVGTESPTLGCTCEYHSVCGCCVDLDSLVRFKRDTVEAGKCNFDGKKIEILLSQLLSIPQMIIPIGLFKEPFGLLKARIDALLGGLLLNSRSASTSKIAYSNKHGGVCLAMLVDKAAPMDSFLNAYLPEVHSESDSDEN
jgi:hypothetical protein